MTIRKKRTVIKKRRVTRRTVSMRRAVSSPKVVIIKVPRNRRPGRKIVLPTNLPEQTSYHPPQSDSSDSGWRRA